MARVLKSSEHANEYVARFQIELDVGSKGVVRGIWHSGEQEAHGEKKQQIGDVRGFGLQLSVASKRADDDR